MNARFRADLNDRAVLRSPLGEPSAKAKAFMPEVDPYASAVLPYSEDPAYVEPDGALQAWSNLQQARTGGAT